MFENRTLGRAEALLRDPASASSNLAANPGTWYEAGPKHADEVWRVSGFECLVAGPSALTHMEDMGGAGVTLEFGFDLFDTTHGIVDFAAVSLHTTDRAEEWNAGTHSGTIVDREAGRYADGTTRLGLRGQPSTAPGTVTWLGPVIPFRYGRAIRFATWQGDFVRDPSGATLAATRLFIDITTIGVSGLSTVQRFPVAQLASELDAGRADFSPALSGHTFRWVVEMDYQPTGAAAFDTTAILRTGVLFQLSAWIESTHPFWRISSLAELLTRASVQRQPYASGWQSTDDVFLVRLEIDLDLRGRFREKMRARLTSPTTLSTLELQPTARLELIEL